MDKRVILVTGASSAFGLMTAKALAEVGHTVYASIRETEGRNAPCVAEIAQWSKDRGLDLRTVELDVQSQTAIGGLRGDGDDQEGAGSGHQRPRHAGRRWPSSPASFSLSTELTYSAASHVSLQRLQ